MLEAIPLKHKAPLRCRLRASIFGVSPSIVLAKCSLGCRFTCKKCTGCERNIREQLQEAFDRGCRAGLAAREKYRNEAGREWI